MPAEVSQRAFDPFFTTKDTGLGCGLGLSRVYGFMHQSGGAVTIDSAPGIGTSIRLYLPLAKDVAMVLPAPGNAAGALPASTLRRILVVEDDQHVRDLVVEVLDGLGYSAIPTESGVTALHLLASGLQVDLVLSDVLMPDGMSGFQLAAEIRRRLPGLAIVLTSGMTGTFEIAADAMPNLPLLRKPYRCEELAQAIATALSGAVAR
jgi:CheY-like chemotaxis protein